MSDMEISKVLTQLKSLSREIGPPAADAAASAAGGADFGAMLAESINEVSGQQQDATSMMHAFERGEDRADLATVMISMQKASVSFQAMTEVRNKLVDAYRDIMNMPI